MPCRLAGLTFFSWPLGRPGGAEGVPMPCRVPSGSRRGSPHASPRRSESQVPARTAAAAASHAIRQGKARASHGPTACLTWVIVVGRGWYLTSVCSYEPIHEIMNLPPVPAIWCGHLQLRVCCGSGMAGSVLPQPWCAEFGIHRFPEELGLLFADP